MNFVYGRYLSGVDGGGGCKGKRVEGWGSRKLVSKGRFPSPISSFKSPLTKSIIYMCHTRNHWTKTKTKIKDLFGSVGIQQKQPYRGVIRKRCSENMQQICRKTPMSKCEFNKLHFGIGILLYIKFATCIFSEYIFLRTPLDGCFWYSPFS